MPLAFPLAALVFLGAFIPIVGATVSGAVAVLVALVAQGPVTALILLAAVIGVQQLEGHVLQPLIMGRAVAIHPLAVILGIARRRGAGRDPGALVAVPIIAVLNTAIRHLARVRRAEAMAAATPPDDRAGRSGPDPRTPTSAGSSSRTGPNPLSRRQIAGERRPRPSREQRSGPRGGRRVGGSARGAGSRVGSRRRRAASTTSGLVVYQNGGSERRRNAP